MEDKKGYEGDFVPLSSRKRYGYSLRLPLTLKPRVQKAAKKKTTDNYLTKRILKSAAKSGLKKAAKKTMQVMGYAVIAKGDWVVREYADGRVEKVSKINPVNRSKRIALD